MTDCQLRQQAEIQQAWHLLQHLRHLASLLNVSLSCHSVMVRGCGGFELCPQIPMCTKAFSLTDALKTRLSAPRTNCRHALSLTQASRVH